ncbi:MAG: Na/Pi cotransporter family protein [Lachnospiraceae bacterium]|nr:Na/Pi cotransporter family protein [uncultured Acetatifactor sp.]MCI9229865.1 Na/Pi cotransporter family protein [Lachnospiraceae bacterium]
MDFFGLLTMIGGLALFLYGMKTMGDALSKMAGGRLEQVLERMTNNPVKAVLLGAGVTAVIQSSSATTVMVVGFVNSGIMKLSQAVGVIMGANIGTTATSWILSLSGIESGNFFIKLLKPSSFSPILALIGVVLVMFIKNTKKNDVGTILIGFAVLMFGMDTMSGAVKPLADVPEFTSLFTAFENPLLGMIVGAILTAVIQSSSASVGILQAMCATGSISVGAALPVIMGQNIGTCVTALISGVGANRNARRASLVHLYFNLIGTVVFMAVFYAMNHFMQFAFLSDTANGAVIAVIHSVFNMASTIVLFPVSGLLVKLAYFTIPQSEDETLETSGKVLDERFLERPAFAVAQCKNAVCDMAQLILKAMNLCVFIQEKYDENAVQAIMEIEQEVDVREDELSSYLAKLSIKPLSERDSKTINKYSRCITDFERISDYAKGIAFAQKKLYKGKEKFSRKAAAEAGMIYEATLETVECTVSGFIHGDKEMAFRIDPLADVISRVKKEIRKNHSRRLEKGECSVELGMALTDMVTSLERIAKHCSNIAEAQTASETDQHALHQYARNVKERDELYKELLERYTEKYSLKKLEET